MPTYSFRADANDDVADFLKEVSFDGKITITDVNPNKQGYTGVHVEITCKESIEILREVMQQSHGTDTMLNTLFEASIAKNPFLQIKFLEGQINPYDANHHNKPLWCVCGYSCFPQILACMINVVTIKADRNYGSERVFGPNIWGYSVYKGVPGYRTLGQELHKWVNSHDEYHDAKFFDNMEKALDYLRTLITPKESAILKIRKA